MFLRLKDHPDFLIAFDTMAGLKPDKSLLGRDDEVKQEFEAHVHTLKRGARSIAGIPGEELIERFNEQNGTTGHSCEWESFSKQNDVLRPELSLEFTTGHSLRPGGKPVESSLSDGAVLALWDKISSSIRVRPTKTVQPVVAEVAIPGIGTGVSANEACPVSGWWQCKDGDGLAEVERGNCQFFRKGVRMPQASLIVPPTLWQRIKRERPTFQHAAPTRWKLVRYEQSISPPQAEPKKTAPGIEQPQPAPASDIATAPPPGAGDPEHDSKSS